MRDNYAITTARAAQLFLGYDSAAMAEKFALPLDEEYLYITFVAAPYRVSRRTGLVERLGGAQPAPAGFNESLTIYDVLCDSKPGCRLSGRYCRVNSLPGVAQTAGLGNDLFDSYAGRFDRDPAALARACEALGGTALTGADVGYTLPLFPFLPVQLRFWHGDEEFPPSLQLLWDEHTPQFMRYETTYYAANHLFTRLSEEA